MECIQEGKALVQESCEENKAGEHIKVKMNDLQTREKTVSIERTTEHEECKGTETQGTGKPCEEEKDNEMLEGNLHESPLSEGDRPAHKFVYTTDDCVIPNPEEAKDGEGKCDLPCMIKLERRKSLLNNCSMNVAGIQTENEEPDGNRDRRTTKQEIFPEHEVRRVLKYFDKESGCLEDECNCSKVGYLALSPSGMPCRAVGGKVNCLSVFDIRETQDSRASDKLALICPQQEVFEMKPGVSIKAREIEFWKTLSTTSSSQVTDMALFLDNFRVASPKPGRETTCIAAKGLNWLKSSSPTNQGKMSDLQSINAQLHRRVQDLESELCEAIFRQSLAESAYQQSMLQMDDLLNKLDTSSDRINELETCHDMNVEEKSEVNSQLQHTERQVIELRVALQNTEEENGDLERKLLEAQKHVQRLGVQVQIGAKQRQQLIYELEEERELSSALQQEIVSLQKTLLSCRKTLDFYKDEVSCKETVEEELKTSNSKLKRRNKKLDGEVSTLQNELRRTERNQLELQEDLWQTQRILDEVKSDYEIVSEEKKAINEELKAFYERHQELKMTYSLCVHEKNEKEQEIAVLVAKVEKSQSEVASNNRYPDLYKHGGRLKKRDKNEDQFPNQRERTMIEGVDLHPLSESAEAVKISLACVRSPYVKDGMNTEVYFYDLQETGATDQTKRDPSNEENLHYLERDDKDIVVRKEQLLEIESLFKQCKKRQSCLENDFANSKAKIYSLQDELINSQQEQLEAYDKVSQLQMKHEDLKATLEKSKQEKGDLLKKAAELTQKVCCLRKKCESERTERRSLQQQLRDKEQKNDGDRSEIRRINQRCMEQNLLLDASEFGMNFF